MQILATPTTDPVTIEYAAIWIGPPVAQFQPDFLRSRNCSTDRS